MKYLHQIFFILAINIIAFSIYHQLYATPKPVVVNINSIIKDKIDSLAKSGLSIEAKNHELTKFSDLLTRSLQNLAQKQKVIIFSQGAIISGAEDYTKKLK